MVGCSDLTHTLIKPIECFNLWNPPEYHKICHMSMQFYQSNDKFWNVEEVITPTDNLKILLRSIECSMGAKYLQCTLQISPVSFVLSDIETEKRPDKACL